MVFGRAQGGRGGGQIGRSGSTSARARELSTAEDLERKRWASDAVRIHNSYRYLRHGLEPTPAFKRRESRYYREPPTSRCSSSASRTPPPRRLNYGDGEASSSHSGRPVPRFDPGDYVADEDILKLAEELERKAPALTAGDFVPASTLGTITALLEEKTRCDVEKEEEWCREQEAQDAAYIELSDSDESE